MKIVIVANGQWIMEGLDRNDDRRIKNVEELKEYINKVGFLPFFKGEVEGFSLEEMTARDAWWSGDPVEDPWEWRGIIAEKSDIAYGKLFCNRAGFISKEWFPIFAAYRRDGYDFDSRYEDGLASIRQKKIIDVLSKYDRVASYELKKLAGFNKGGEKNFEGTLTSLQMQTYVLIRSFRRKKNKKNQEYGWAVADYTLSENIYGGDYVRSAYHLSAQEAKDIIINHLLKLFPDAKPKEAEKLIK
ncbi:AlkZ-related protein [Herbinix hemicellulosilytica]|uniref:AlkZ-related protein n=1 Tax=Herbinix hemicellulosilytica TaxID=1564487 RepID=UPI002E8DEF06|nr:hypothetical protein [Herbinix hemicellulosilytica]